MRRSYGVSLPFGKIEQTPRTGEAENPPLGGKFSAGLTGPGSLLDFANRHSATWVLTQWS
eukprot:COSAG02_NODE_176_length_31159_cov_30.469833_17_plen_60_part_00